MREGEVLMGFFCTLKNIIHGIIGGSQEQKKFEKLKKGELTLIADDDLRTAVMSWMWSKFNKNWTNEYAIIESMPKPCQDVYACCAVVDEINNGGLNQLFFITAGQFAKMAQDGFAALGNEKLSSVLGAAIEIYQENKELLAKYNDGTIESFSKSYNEKLFDELDEEFSQEEPEFDRLLLTYIRNNESAFGD